MPAGAFQQSLRPKKGEGHLNTFYYKAMKVSRQAPLFCVILHTLTRSFAHTLHSHNEETKMGTAYRMTVPILIYSLFLPQILFQQGEIVLVLIRILVLVLGHVARVCGRDRGRAGE